MQFIAEQRLCLFTPLEEFKVNQDYAKPGLLIMHYTELLKEKQLVLMRGEIEPKMLQVTEAQCLVNQMQLYYLSEKYDWVKTFNESPQDFNYQLLLEDMGHKPS